MPFLISQHSSWISDLALGLPTSTSNMPRKKASNDTNNQASALRQPTLAGFMANPTAKPQPTTKAPPESSKATTSTTPTSAAKLKIGHPASKRRSKRTKSPKKKNPKKSPKKRKPIKKAAPRKSPSEENSDGSDTETLQAIRFESQEETHTGGSTIEVTSSDEDEEDQFVSPSRPKHTTQKKRKIRASSGSSDSDVEVIGGSAGAPRKGKRRLKRRLMSSDEENATETKEDEAPSPKKRRLIKGLKPSTSEEEIDLMDEVDEHRKCGLPDGDHDPLFGNWIDIVVGIVDSRLRTRNKKTAFQQSLETLKRTLPHTQKYFIISPTIQARGVDCL